jgi:hypothetical protein
LVHWLQLLALLVLALAVGPHLTIHRNFVLQPPLLVLLLVMLVRVLSLLLVLVLVLVR